MAATNKITLHGLVCEHATAGATVSSTPTRPASIRVYPTSSIIKKASNIRSANTCRGVGSYEWFGIVLEHA